MVAVPGRSGACHTCKQRRVRCDLGKPVCKACIKSKRVCGGYQTTKPFVLSKYVASSDPRLDQDALKRANEAGTAPVVLSRWRLQEPQAVAGRQSTQRIMSPGRGGLRTLSIHPRNAVRNQLLARLIDDNVSSSPARGNRDSQHRHWLFQLNDLTSLSPALENSVLAVTVARLGRRQNQLQLARESLSLYARGLGELQRAIDDPVTRYDAQTVAACVSLIMYEFMECPGRAVAGYMNHYSGAMRILELRGAMAHDSGLAHGVLQVLRIHAVFQGLARRKPTLLSDSEWLEAPFRRQSKTPHDELVDLFLRAPIIYADFDSAVTVTPNLFHRCAALAGELDAWFRNYKAASCGPLYWPELSNDSLVETDDHGKLFPVQFSFPNVIVAETMLMFWGLQALLQSHMCKLHRHLVDAETPHGLLPALGQAADWPQTARNACQSIEYFFREENMHFGPAMAFPFIVLLRGILCAQPKPYHRELLWLGRVIERIQSSGSQLAGCI